MKIYRRVIVLSRHFFCILLLLLSTACNTVRVSQKISYYLKPLKAPCIEGPLKIDYRHQNSIWSDASFIVIQNTSSETVRLDLETLSIFQDGVLIPNIDFENNPNTTKTLKISNSIADTSTHMEDISGYYLQNSFGNNFSAQNSTEFKNRRFLFIIPDGTVFLRIADIPNQNYNRVLNNFKATYENMKDDTESTPEEPVEMIRQKKEHEESQDGPKVTPFNKKASLFKSFLSLLTSKKVEIQMDLLITYKKLNSEQTELSCSKFQIRNAEEILLEENDTSYSIKKHKYPDSRLLGISSQDRTIFEKVLTTLLK